MTFDFSATAATNSFYDGAGLLDLSDFYTSAGSETLDF